MAKMSEEQKKYRAALRKMVEQLELGIRGAEMGKFAPEAKNFMITNHDKLREKMLELERILGGLKQ